MMRGLDIRNETRDVFGLAQEPMLEQGVRRSPLVDVDVEAFVQEVPEVGGEVLGLGGGLALLRDEVHGLQWCLLHVGWLTVQHLQGEDSGAPDVDLGTTVKKVII